MNSILFGFKGCGKTHFGNLLAKRLQCPFVDTDELILQLYAEISPQKCTIKSLYQLIGEEEFRKLEVRAIASLRKVKNSVIALGGGAILEPKNLALLQRVGVLIYLQASFDTIQARGVSLLVGPIEQLYRERTPVYESISAHRICIDSLTEEQVVASLNDIITQGVHLYGC